MITSFIPRNQYLQIFCLKTEKERKEMKKELNTQIGITQKFNFHGWLDI